MEDSPEDKIPIGTVWRNKLVCNEFMDFEFVLNDTGRLD